MNRISIVGNIGCGKTTLIRSLNEQTRIPIFLEPVESWKDWLQLFYDQPERWALSFNLNVILSFHDWKNNTFKGIYERSPMCCKHVFTAMQYENGQMTQMEYDTFCKIYDQLCWEPDVIIYLKVDPHTSLSRTQKRNRTCESKITLSYLEDVDRKYNEMVQHIKNNKPYIQVYIVDANQDEALVLEEVTKIIHHNT